MTLQRPMFPPSRRRFFAIAGGASAAAVAVVLQPAFAAPAESLDSSKASPALKTALLALADSHDSLEAAKARFMADDAKVAEWVENNPEPEGKRAKKRYWRKWREMQEVTNRENWNAQLEAEEHFRTAQFAVAQIKAADMNELTLMAAAASVYDTTKLAGGQQAVISYGVAIGLFRLQQPKGVQS